MQIQPAVKHFPDIRPKKLVCCIIREPVSMLIPRCGLYVINRQAVKQTNCSVSLPLQHMDYEVEIVDNIASITLTQTYENPLDTNLQVEYSLPINPKVCLNSFRAVFGKVEVVGLVKEKEQAKAEYEKGLKEGRQVAYAEINQQSKDIVNLKIGNIKAHQKVEIKMNLLVMLEVSLSMFWTLMIPATISPRYLNEELPPAEFNPHTKSIEASEPPAYTWSFKVGVRSSRPITSCKSTTHDLLQLSLSTNQTTLVMEQSCRPNKDFVFQYSVQHFEQPSCLVGRTDVSTSALVSFIPKFCEVTLDDALKSQLQNRPIEFDMETARAEYLFLLDRSGSMSGARIEKAKQALVFFLRSLPQQSYFDVYSFGNSFKAMFGKSCKYDNATLKRAVDAVESMSANMGGTNIGSALEAIFSSPVIEGYPKQIFLLTDGAVSNTEGVIQLVGQHTKFCRVHTIGIGNGASPALIQGCAEKGKGRHIFIQDDANVSAKIIELLSAALSPVITDFKMQFDESVVESVTPNPKSMPYILKDEPVSLFFIFKHGFEGEMGLKVKYTVDGRNYEKEILVSNTGTLTVPWVDKMAHHRALQIMCGKLGAEKALGEEMLFAKVNSLQEYIVRDSVKHQILCPLTAFVCVGKPLGDAELQLYQSQDSLKIEVPNHDPYEKQKVHIFAGKHGSAKMMPLMSQPMSSMTRSSAVTTNNAPVMYQRARMKCAKPSSSSTILRKSIAMEEKCQMIQERRMVERQQIQMMMEDEEEEDCEMKMQKRSKKEVEIKDMKKKKSEAVQKEDKKDVKSGAVEQLLGLQQTDGSWDSSEPTRKLIAKTVQIQEKVLEEAAEKFKSWAWVLTIVLVAWLEKHHNNPEYQLLLRKAKGWINKYAKQAQLDPKEITGLQNLVK